MTINNSLFEQTRTRAVAYGPRVQTSRICLAGLKQSVWLLIIALMPFLWNSGLGHAHSLKYAEEKLQKMESFLQIVNREVPEFSLLNVDGQIVRLNDFRNKVVILNFIFASCTDLCPMHTQKLISIQKMINSTPMRDVVQFISITTDPAQDTPEVLRNYVRDQGVDPVNWIFLTSGTQKPTGTRDLALRFGLKFTLTDDGQQVHGAVTHLIDKEGRMRARYHGLKFDDVNFLQHANTLVNDYDKHKPGSDPAATVRNIASIDAAVVDGGFASFRWIALGVLSLLALTLIGALFLKRRSASLQ